MSEVKQKKIRKRWKILIWTFCLILIFCLYLTNVVNPIIYTSNKAKIESEVVSSINNAVAKTLTTDLYDSLINVEKNDLGNIVLMTCKSSNVNKLTNQIIDKCQNDFENLGNTGFDVSLLTFSGISFLNGIGPNVNIKMQPIGHVDCLYKSNFISSGINQTLHQIYIDIKAQISILLPMKPFTIEVSSKILVAESVIVGEIPEVFLNGSLLGNMLNLVP